MRTELISIGSELTTGRNLDTNSQWLSRRLAEIGIPVHWHTTIADDLEANLESFRLATQRCGLVLCTGGLGESQIEEKLLDLTKRGHVPEVGITASDATISLRIFAQAPTREEALSQVAPIEQIIRERLGDLVFGVDDEEMQHVVLRLLAEKKMSLGCAESATGGQIASRLTSISGSSAWFRGGVVAYD